MKLVGESGESYEQNNEPFSSTKSGDILNRLGTMSFSTKAAVLGIIYSRALGPV
jgi:hypothetical protein